MKKTVDKEFVRKGAWLLKRLVDKEANMANLQPNKFLLRKEEITPIVSSS